MLSDHIEELVGEHSQRVYGGDMPVENKQTLRTRLRHLFKHAIPGNWAWHTLENEYGFSGDYTEADHGTHWSDNTR